MNERELARMALELLSRAQLTGKEVPAFVEVNNWLQDLVNKPPQENKT